MSTKARRLLTAGALLMSSLLWACGSSNHNDGGGGGGGGGDTNRGSVAGSVQISNGNAVGNAQVRLLRNGQQVATASTNEQGFFSITGVEPGTGLTLQVNSDGHVRQVQSVDVAQGRRSFLDNLTVAAAASPQGLNATAGGQLTWNLGGGLQGSLNFPAGALQLGTSRQANNVNVRATFRLASDADFAVTFPGRMFNPGSIAIPGDMFHPGNLFTATDSPLSFRGLQLLDLALSDLNGGAVGLGGPAAVEFPVTGGAAAAALQLFRLDESTGQWSTAGEATLDDTVDPQVYRASVDSEGVWALGEVVSSDDLAFETIIVRSPAGNVVANAWVVIEGSGWVVSGWTNSDGGLSVPVPANEAIRITVSSGTSNIQLDNEQTGNPGANTVREVTLDGTELAITLTWGEFPTDLDSHLTGPTTDGSRFHTYFARLGSLSAAPHAALDTDDVTSYGPEITSISQLNQGVYRFSVHNYSQYAQYPGDNVRIQNSGAQVNLSGLGIERNYTPPLTNPNDDTVWQVFELHVDANGTVTVQDLNTWTTSATAGAVQRK